MPRSCAGRVALVTGASKGGTGTSLAVRLAAEGASVAITARSQAGLDDCRKAIEVVGGEAVVLPCDLSDPDGGREELVARTEAALGPLDILVNNAAAGGYAPFDQFGRADFLLQQEVNVWAPWVLMQQAIPGMRERGRGWVLNMTTSVAALPQGPPFASSGPSKAGTLYGGTKAMLNRVTVGVASEVEGQGIAVNALTPQAAILTPALVPAQESGMIHPDLFEPLDTMVEAALALCTEPPEALHGRIAYSLDLLLELQRPVRGLHGESLTAGWQPADLPARLEAQRAAVSQGDGGAYGLERTRR
jgi:NAD(P)-dependent dehydrogenase (short-subunit alcohol dehydrogenase family)